MVRSQPRSMSRTHEIEHSRPRQHTPPSMGPPSRTWMRHGLAVYGLPALLLTMLVMMWEVFVWWREIPVWLLPAPSDVLLALINNHEILATHVGATLLVALVGLLCGLVAGVGLALVLDASSLARRALSPLLIASQTIPIVAIAPLLVVGFGFGILPKVIVVALVTFFPIVISMFDGLQSADRDAIRLLRAMNASHWQMVRLVRLPSALPSLFSGMKIAVSYSIIGAVIAEWIGARAGLGVYIARSLRGFRTDHVFVAAFATSLLTIVLFVLVVLLERWCLPWNRQRRSSKNEPE